MPDELVKACLNLHAVLPNLEELIAFDVEARQLTSTWDIAIEFNVHNGPRAHVVIRNGQCRVGRGPSDRCDVRLWFTSPAHLNAMFANKGTPIPTKGFTRLGFVSKEFLKLTGRLEHFLRASPEMLKDTKVFDFVTRCMLFTAVYGLRELCEHDPGVSDLVEHTPMGVAEFAILPDGPAAHLTRADHGFSVAKGTASSPNARMQFRNSQVCYDLLNGRIDAFAALGRGDVTATGFLPLVDQLNAILERLEPYLK